MSYRIISKARQLSKKERSTKLGRIDIWFDPSDKLWVTQYINDGGFQLTDEKWASQYDGWVRHAILAAQKHDVEIHVESRDGSKITIYTPAGDGKFKQAKHDRTDLDYNKHISGLNNL